MHFVVARLTQADEIVCVIRKLRMFVRVLDVVHGRRWTAPPIPQAMPTQIAIPPQHRCSQPPPSRRVVIKAHGLPLDCCALSSRPLADTLSSVPLSSSSGKANLLPDKIRLCARIGQTTSIHKCSPVLAYVSQTQPLGRGHGRYAFLFIFSPSSCIAKAPGNLIPVAPRAPYP